MPACWNAGQASAVPPPSPDGQNAKPWVLWRGKALRRAGGRKAREDPVFGRALSSYPEASFCPEPEASKADSCEPASSGEPSLPRHPAGSYLSRRFSSRLQMTAHDQIEK